MIAPLVGALLFLGLGIAEVALVNRSIYPSLRWRYEKAKITQSQVVKPSTIMTLVKLQSLVLLPVLGFLIGSRMKFLG